MTDAFSVWLVVLTVGVPIAVVVVLNGAEARHRGRLVRLGRSTTAHVAELGCDHGDGITSSTYWARVQYDDDGDFVTGRIALSHAEYERTRVGARIRVSYLPGRPTSARHL